MAITKIDSTQRARRQVKTINLSYSGKLERQVLEDGRWVVCSHQWYSDTEERNSRTKSATAWCDETPNSRVVDHCQEQGKPRHKIVAEWQMPAKPEPSGDFYPEVVQVEVEDAEALRQFLADETGLAWRVYHYQGVDYTPPSVQ